MSGLALGVAYCFKTGKHDDRISLVDHISKVHRRRIMHGQWVAANHRPGTLHVHQAPVELLEACGMKPYVTFQQPGSGNTPTPRQMYVETLNPRALNPKPDILSPRLLDLL